MKTLQELYTEIMASDELKKSFVQASKENKQLEFIKEHGVETTAEELNSFLAEKAKIAENKKLSAEELDNVAGGACDMRSAFTATTDDGTYYSACIILEKTDGRKNCA